MTMSAMSPNNLKSMISEPDYLPLNLTVEYYLFEKRAGEGSTVFCTVRASIKIAWIRFLKIQLAEFLDTTETTTEAIEKKSCYVGSFNCSCSQGGACDLCLRCNADHVCEKDPLFLSRFSRTVAIVLTCVVDVGLLLLLSYKYCNK